MDAFRPGPKRRDIGENIKRFFLSNSILSRLILVNAAVFLLIQVFMVVSWLINANLGSGQVSWWIGAHAWLPELIRKPWGVFTYMFVQIDFWHIFWNMFMLYFGAQIFIPIFGQRRLLNVYILGGLSGVAFFILAMNAFPRFAPSLEVATLIGASASVLAIIFAAASHSPRMEVNLFLIGRVRLIYIALFFIAIDIFTIPRDNAGGHIAHLGGAFMGYLYVLSMKRFKLPSVNLSSLFRRKPKAGPRFYDPEKERPLSDEEFNERRKKRQERIDEILDKLKEKGYEGLTKEEKEILHKASQ